jgi:cell division protein FtsZ
MSFNFQKEEQEEELIVHSLDMEEDIEARVENLPVEDEQTKTNQLTQINQGISAEQMAIRSRQRMERLRNISMKLRTPSGLTDLESQPAYKRREVKLDDTPHSSESSVSKYSLGNDSDDNPVIKPNNFLHDNVD